MHARHVRRLCEVVLGPGTRGESRCRSSVRDAPPRATRNPGAQAARDRNDHSGAIGIRQCVERLREDANNSTQKERFELQIDACITCGQWWIHIRDDAKIGIADHDCTGKRKIYYTRILWTSTLALLLNLDLDEMASYGVKYDKTTARQRLPSRFRDSALPAAGNPPCILPNNSLQSHATSAAVDALVVSAAIRGCQTVAARVQARKSFTQLISCLWTSIPLGVAAYTTIDS